MYTHIWCTLYLLSLDTSLLATSSSSSACSMPSSIPKQRYASHSYNAWAHTMYAYRHTWFNKCDSESASTKNHYQIWYLNLFQPMDYVPSKKHYLYLLSGTFTSRSKEIILLLSWQDHIFTISFLKLHCNCWPTCTCKYQKGLWPTSTKIHMLKVRVALEQQCKKLLKISWSKLFLSWYDASRVNSTSVSKKLCKLFWVLQKACISNYKH